MVLSIHTTVVLFIDMTPSCIVCLEQILRWGSTHTIYDNTVTCFLSLCDSWAACPHFHCEVTEWLCIYQGIWVGVACCVTSPYLSVCFQKLVQITVHIAGAVSWPLATMIWTQFLFFSLPLPSPTHLPLTTILWPMSQLGMMYEAGLYDIMMTSWALKAVGGDIALLTMTPFVYSCLL